MVPGLEVNTAQYDFFGKFEAQASKYQKPVAKVTQKTNVQQIHTEMVESVKNTKEIP